MPSAIALIPARSGSERIKDKNIKILKGHPLIAYTISSAIKSGIFSRVIVSTDSSYYSKISQYYGAEVRSLRPKKISRTKSPDIEWVAHELEKDANYDCFVILRPTSPFRSEYTIKRAYKQFCQSTEIDSIRAVELCSQHPGKMWTNIDGIIKPYTIGNINGIPFHSNQYAALPTVYIQNASLEIAWMSTFLHQNSISGEIIAPFFTINKEGFDINNDYDWKLVKQMVKEDKSLLTSINMTPFK